MAYIERGNGGKNFNNRPNKEFQKTAQFPQGYLDGGYYEIIDGEKVLKKEYIVDYSRKIAQALQDIKEKSDQNKRSQIRKFYEYALGIQSLLQRKNGDFRQVEAELNRLIPFVEYARSRGTITEFFRQFIEKNILAIHDMADLTAFIKHFEAIVAYLPKEKN